MADQQASTSRSSSSNIRQRDNNGDDDDTGEPSQKHQRLNNDNNDDDDSDAPDPPRSITNICYDVLERIFEFLDMESFLNLANTCKRMQIAAAAKFHDDYRNKKIVLKISNNGQISYSESLITIRVVGLNYCLPFLRCFGAKCLHLTISSIRQNDHLNEYINRYCADTLTSIHYVQESSFKLETSPKPFKNVHNVHIGHWDLGQNLPLIAQLFPNLNRLEMYSISMDENFTAVSFPHLKDLAIYNNNNTTMNALTNLLHANRQLETLQLQLFNKNEGLTLTELSNLIAESPDIKKIWISSRHEIAGNRNELLRLANDHPVMFSLDLFRYLIEVDDAIQFMRQMTSLKMFRFKLKENNEYDRLVNRLDDEWKHRIIIFDEDDPRYSLNNIVTLNR